jgi:hypothetical protein
MANAGVMPGIEDRPMMAGAGMLPMPRLASVPAVYAAIQRVSGELAKTGIGKDGRNQQQNYSFRGVEQVLNTLAPALVQHGLVMLPRMMSREVVERTTAKGSLQFFVTVAAEFDFVAVADGSKHTVVTYGEAQDTADKATNKAMSAAYKYAAFLAFCIPLKGVLDDADERTPEESVAPVPSAPAGFDDWLADLEAVAAEGEPALKAAWVQSNVELRRHLTSTANDRWTAIKAKAAKVGA